MQKQLENLLIQAIKANATDIHFNLEDGNMMLQFRSRGQMVKIDSDLCSISLFRYLQYRANLDISDILKPQTGQFEMELNNRCYALRFAVVHSLNMVSGVLRILDADFNIKVKELTMNRNHQDILGRILNYRNGLVLISGPTGSGKTTTLYTLLQQVKGRKIFTLEDPIEIYSHQYVQIQLNEKQGLDYEEGIRQLLRHDPDIIMIGEIRDAVAAQMAVRCALTGHLVVSTIHASSAVSAIERMLELKVSQRQLQDVCRCITNQRLYSLKNKKGRTGAYEIIQRNQIEAYFKGEDSSLFVSIHHEIESLVQSGFVTKKQAQFDLFD